MECVQYYWGRVFLTVAVFGGLSLITPNQHSLEKPSTCDAGIVVGKKLLVFEVVSFSFFLFSSVLAQQSESAIGFQKEGQAKGQGQGSEIEVWAPVFEEGLKVVRCLFIDEFPSLEELLEVEAEIEIQELKQQCMMLECTSHPFVVCVDEMAMESVNDPEPNLDELIYLVGGYNGVSWLSALDSYSPTTDVIKSLKPMNHGRAYVSIAWLNGELYVFGGGNGSLWVDTV